MAHTHHCSFETGPGLRCNEVVAVCDDGHCQGDDGHFCSRHHHDPAFRVEDKPTVRMTVGIDPEQILHIRHD